MLEFFGLVIATFVGAGVFVVTACAEQEVQDGYKELKNFLAEKLNFSKVDDLQEEIDKSIKKNKEVSDSKQNSFAEDLEEAAEELKVAPEEKQSIIDELTRKTQELSNLLNKIPQEEYVKHFGEVIGQRLKDKSKAFDTTIEQIVSMGGVNVTGMLLEGESGSKRAKITQKIEKKQQDGPNS